MNHLKPLLFLATVLGGAVLAAPVAPTPEQSAQIRRQVDVLLKGRLQPAPLPVDPPNPFIPLVPGPSGLPAAVALPPATPVPAPAAERPPEDAEILARFASGLRITGIIRVKGQVHVIINDTPWKEGDLIIVSRDPVVVQLQVARIQPGQLTLKLEDAELVLRF